MELLTELRLEGMDCPLLATVFELSKVIRTKDDG